MLEGILITHNKLKGDEMLCIKCGEFERPTELALSTLCRAWIITDEGNKYLVTDLGNYTMKIPEEKIINFYIYKQKLML